MNFPTDFSSRGACPPIDSPIQQHQRQFTRASPESSGCFKCSKQGHWARDCPEKSPLKSKQSALVKCDSEFPQLLCRCGFGFCYLQISGTNRNPNRKFYSCPGTLGRRCGFFKWCDEVTVNEINNPIHYRFPECQCGAGTCHFVKLQTGPNAGRWCFVCSIPKGHGACSFSQLFYAPRDVVNFGQAQSENISSPVSMPNSFESDFMEEEDLSFKQLKRDCEPPVNDKSQHSLSPYAISEPLKRIKVLLCDGSGVDKKSASSSPTPCDQLAESFVANANKSSLLTSHADIHNRQIEFRRLISSSGPSSFEENFDAKLQSSHSQEVQISTRGIVPTNLFKDKISELHLQTASEEQNHLLDQLQSMDILDHESMLKISNSVFDSLNRLEVDYSTFRERVMEFIRCASLLADIEWSSCNVRLSSQELVERYTHEKDHFNSVSCKQVETMAAITAANGRLKSFREEASSLKNKLLRVENELLVCEAETIGLEDQLVDISKEVSLSQQSLKEVEEGLKVCGVWEKERRAMKAALENARLQLPTIL